MSTFGFDKMAETITPQLVINKGQLKSNIEKVIALSGGTDRLWPHIKTHKSLEVVQLLLSYGITNFKCATIAECELAAMAGAERVLFAYPMVTVNIDRFLKLKEAYPRTEFHALTDDMEQLKLIDSKCKAAKVRANIMLDVNTGMNRTGIPIDSLSAFYTQALSNSQNIDFTGFHCYDGDRHETDFELRQSRAEVTYTKMKRIMEDYPCRFLVMGGSPSFSCYIRYDDVMLSPGTIFLNDNGYYSSFRDLPFPPAAAVLTRVISNPAPGYFTLDLGYKGIAADPVGQRGIILGMPNAKPVLQNEEHWVWSVENTEECPKVGTDLFVIPTHICPTSALYPFVIAVEDGKQIGCWEVTARNRKINF